MIACSWLQTNLYSDAVEYQQLETAKMQNGFIVFGKALCAYTCCLDKFFLTHCQLCMYDICYLHNLSFM